MDFIAHINLEHMTHLQLLEMAVRLSGKARVEVHKTETVRTIRIKSLATNDTIALMNGDLAKYNGDEEKCLEMNAQLLLLDFAKGSIDFLVNRLQNK